ncbi:MAG: hypothetical protein ABI866_08620, partial [Dokdonella sp.]
MKRKNRFYWALRIQSSNAKIVIKKQALAQARDSGFEAVLPRCIVDAAQGLDIACVLLHCSQPCHPWQTTTIAPALPTYMPSLA